MCLDARPLVAALGIVHEPAPTKHGGPMYRRLDPDKIVATLETLHARISERFPGSGLALVCSELTAIGGATCMRAERLARPNRVLRAASGLVIVTGIGIVSYLVHLVRELPANREVFGLMQGIDAAVHL